MSFMSSIAAAGPQASAFNAVGAADSSGAGNLERMFAQLMQQIEAAMDQPINGSDLPSDGELLPSELFSQLTGFAEQLEAELSPEQLRQLDELIGQLTAESVPQEQIEQLAQAALLMQDAQLEKRSEPDSLLQLVDAIRATSADTANHQGQDKQQHSIDELLALADRLREASAPALEAQAATVQAVSVRADKAAADLQVEADSAATVTEVGAGLVAAVAASSDLKQAPEDAQVSVTSAADIDANEAVVELSAAVRQEQLVADRAKEPAAGKLAPAAPLISQPASTISQAAAQAVKPGLEEAAAAPGKQESSDQDSQQQGRRESLSRWVELRDSVALQGQRLAQNDAVFKGVLANQSSQGLAGEAGSLVQAERAGNLAQLQQAYQASTTSNLTLGVGERFGGEKWTPAASQRILWMAGQNVSSAELKLDPPELGSLTVRLQIRGDQASLNFTSPHAHVREVLEQQMPRLREMLSENGIDLGQADVSDQSLAKGSGDEAAAGSQGHSDGAEADLDEQQDGLPQPASVALSLVDYYA